MKVQEEKAEVVAETEMVSHEAELPGVPVENTERPLSDESEPKEAFLGGLLLFCLVLSIIAATGFFGFAGYRYFKGIQAEKSIPSIDSLLWFEVAGVSSEVVSPVSENTAAKADESKEKPAVTVDKQALTIKVLNGGSAKGVAGTYAERLKTAGFTKTTVGNSFGNYTGQTLYHAKGQEAAAQVLKTEVVKTYPNLIVKEAPVADKDAAAATFVLILGR
jgi:hypothetical protein